MRSDRKNSSTFLSQLRICRAHLESVYLRHIDVQQYQVRAAEAELLQRLLPVGHVYDFVACFFEEAFQEQRICGVVVGKQDF